MIAAAEKAYRQGQYHEAELQFVQAEKEAESFGLFDHRLAKTLNNLGRLYVREARYREAEPLFKRALGIWERDGDSVATDRAATQNNLAALYAYQSRYGEAELIYQQCLALREKSLGREHPDVGNTLNNLGVLYWEQGKIAGSRTTPPASRIHQERTLGPEDPELATGLNNLAACISAKGNRLWPNRSICGH